MRILVGAVLVAALVACGGGNAAKATSGFRSTVHAAWQSASSTPTGDMNGERQAATAWRGFAVTVQGVDAGKDAVAQGQLVALGNEAADAYSATVAAFQCEIRSTIEPGPACPPKPATSPAVFVAQIRQMVQAL